MDIGRDGERRANAGRLGGDIEQFFCVRGRGLEKNCSVVDLWGELMPKEFYNYCRLADISSGVLYVEATPGPYMHELRLLSSELLERVQTQCPRAGIKKIVIRPKRDDLEKMEASDDRS
jgi:hypothetical protein